jgi:hypothetical protein
VRPPIKQKTDTLIELCASDDRIKAQSKILMDLRAAVRANVRARPSRTAEKARLEMVSPLYIRYRGIRFPLKQPDGRKIPSWRELSPWFKVQVASCCLMEQENNFIQFRYHPHGMLVDALNEDIKDDIRDAITRIMRRRYSHAAKFFFVIEDRDREGNATRPHLHGSIALPPLPLPITKTGLVRARWRRMIANEGREAAEAQYRRECVADVLAMATGNDGSRPRFHNNVDQTHNKWTGKPVFFLSNAEYVNYCFKAVHKASATLPEQRLAFSTALRQESRRLWSLIRDGEPALAAWQ